MTANQADYSIQMMSPALGVSRSGFYAHSNRRPSARSVADEALCKRIAKIHEVSKKTYGAPVLTSHRANVWDGKRPLRSSKKRSWIKQYENPK